MTKGKVRDARADAVELWSTWRGRYVDADPTAFRDVNHCNDCARLVKDAKYAPPPVDGMVGPITMHINGAFIVPWPLLTKEQANALSAEQFENHSVESVFGLRARWCGLFSSVDEYRSLLVELLENNDRDNIILNRQLKQWNARLQGSGFPLFTDNDLRGINLSGLELNGPKYNGVALREVDLSFAELSVAQLEGAYLYGAILRGAYGWQTNIMYALCNKADFSGAILTDIRCQGADLSFTKFKGTHSYRGNFSGSSLYHAIMDGGIFNDASFGQLDSPDADTLQRTSTELHGLSWDESTCFKGVKWDELDATKYSELVRFIRRQNINASQTEIHLSWYRRLLGAFEVKPGWFGFSIDLRRLFQGKSKHRSKPPPNNQH